MKGMIIFCVFIMILVFAQFAQGQTLDEVLDKHLAAMGGKEKLATLNSVHMEGNLTVQGTDVGVAITKLYNVGTRSDIAVMGTQNYMITTMTKGTVFMPVFGQSSPNPMPDDQWKAEQPMLDLHGVFVDYTTKGTQLELKGKETVDGMECYKVAATFKNGSTINFYIDTKTDRIYKTTTKLTVNGEAVESFTNFTNYKQNADGFWFAYSTTNSRGTTDFDKIETNIKVDESIFK